MISLNYESQNTRTRNQVSPFPSFGRISVNEAPANNHHETCDETIQGFDQHGSNDMLMPGGLPACAKPLKKSTAILNPKNPVKLENQKVQHEDLTAKLTAVEVGVVFDDLMIDSDTSERSSPVWDYKLKVPRSTQAVWSGSNKKYLDAGTACYLGDEDREDLTLGESTSENFVYSVLVGEADCPTIREEGLLDCSEDATEVSTCSYLDSITVDSIPATKATYRTNSKRKPDTRTPKLITTSTESPKMRRRRILEESLRKQILAVNR